MNPSDDFIFGPNDFGELNGSCQRCGVQYGSAAELKLHFATIHQRQTFECFVCNKLFLQKFNFLAHIDRVHPDLGKNFSCQYCDRVYTTKSALDSHILQSHKDPLLICPMCQKHLPSTSSLKKHLANCHDMKKIDTHPYECRICHRAYKSQSGLAFHNKSSHQDTEYKCDICGKSFSRPSNVARHVETIHTKTKTFPCKYCGKDFKSTGGRDMHIHADHRGIRFDCGLCGKEFKRKGSLDRHVLGVHGQGESSMFKCTVCLKEFKQKSHLKTHLKNIHHQDMDGSHLREGLPTQVPFHSLFKEEPPHQAFQVYAGDKPVIL